ncbi:hypothetical protein Bca4012_032323 [Brassica carinata]
MERYVTAFVGMRFYRIYWIRWDSSPNRKLIHEIIDAFEDSLAMKKRKKDRRKQWSKSSIQGCVE